MTTATPATKTPAPRTPSNVPSDACVLDSSLSFQASSTFVEGEVNLLPVSMMARTPDEIDHPFWGRLVHDFDGMILNGSSVGIDANHSDGVYDQLGFMNDIDADTDAGLRLRGSLISRSATDQAAHIHALGSNGYPWKSSIDFRGPGLRMQFVDEGEVAEVNGRQFEGPGYIARQWQLRKTAIVCGGGDPDATVQLSDDIGGETFADIFTLSDGSSDHPKPSKGSTMSEETKTDTTDDATDEQKTLADVNAYKQRVKLFVETFGPDGAEMALDDSLSFEAAKAQHADKQVAAATAAVEAANATLADEKAKNEKLTAKLAELAGDNLGGDALPSTAGDKTLDDGDDSQGKTRVLDDIVAEQFARLKGTATPS